MSKSSLREIYKNIEETHVELNGDVVRVRGLDNLKTAVNAANLPLRLLLPVGSSASGKNLMVMTADGSGRNGIWTIPELFLLALATSGKGLEEFAGTLVDYVVEFESAFLFRRTDAVNYVYNNLALETGMYEWPIGSEVWYFGCRAIHTVTELI